MFSLLSECRIPRWVVSVDNVIVFSLSSSENDFLEYDLGLFSRTVLDLSGRSCFACLLTTFVIICSSFSHWESSAMSSAQARQPQYNVLIINPILCSFSSIKHGLM